jgi:putative transposase
MNRDPFAPGEFYHLYNRGVDKREIFTNDHDRNRLALLLYLCNSIDPVNIQDSLSKGETFSQLWAKPQGKQLVSIGAWCFMPNHFHILVKEIGENGISRFMRKITTGYTMYFNNLNNRTGALFQGVFKATHASDSQHLKYLYSYIHLNPLKIVNRDWREALGGRPTEEGLYKSFLRSYAWSSLPDYTAEGFRPQRSILSPSEFPEYFTTTSLIEELHSWLDL